MRSPALNLYYTSPCAIIALATFTKPAMFAPVQNRKSVKKKSATADFFRIIEKTHSPRDWRVAAKQAPALNLYYTKPCAIMALATFTKPAMFAPAT